MGQPRTVHGTGQWYVIARHGDMVMRVRPRMSLGETAAGELSFEASCALLELDIDDDGGLVLSAVGGHELEWAGGARCHRERLARDRGAEIRLPHNILLLDTDFVEEIPAPPPTEDITESQIPAADPVVDITESQSPTARQVEDIAEPQVGPFSQVLLRNPADAVVAGRPPRSPGPDEQTTVGDGSADVATERGLRRPRILSPSIAALVGLASIGLVLLYLALREDGGPGPATTVAGQARQTASAETSVAVSREPNADVLPTAVPLPPKPQLLPPDAPPAAEPESRKRQEVAERPVERLPEPAPKAAPAREPVVQPPVEPASVSQVAQIAGADEAVAVPKPIEKKVATERDAPVATRPQESSETTRRQAAEQARRRALFAADQALAQGRLTTPREASAYTLYSRVLALDPASPEARSGLQSVREGLINRALAELAGNALDDARNSLQAAADAGADPLLVTNLRDEVDYRQRLINAPAQANE